MDLSPRMVRLILLLYLRFLPGMFLHKALREISLFFRKLNGKLHK